MSKYHINSNGVPAVCNAVVGVCPYGDSLHFASEEAASKAFEGTMKKLSKDKYTQLTDKQFDIAKVVGHYNKNMLLEIGARGDIEAAKAALDASDNRMDVSRALAVSDKRTYLMELSNQPGVSLSAIPEYNLDAIIAAGDSDNFDRREMSFASRNAKDSIAYAKVLEVAVSRLGRNKLTEDEVLMYARIENNQGVSLNLVTGISQIEDKAVSQRMLQEYKSANYNQYTSAVRGANAPTSKAIYEATGDYNLDNPNLSSEVIADVSTKTVDSNTFGKLYDHPNVDNNTKYKLQQAYPDFYNARYNYANTRMPKSEIRDSIVVSSSEQKLNQKGTYVEYEYVLDKDFIRNKKLTEDDVVNLFGYNAGYDYNENDGVIKVRIDSGD